MKNKALTMYIVGFAFILLCWLVIQLSNNIHRARMAKFRNDQISETMKTIGTLKVSLLDPNDIATISARDLNTFIEINRLEGRIRDHRMEKAIEQAKWNSLTLTDLIFIFPLILFGRLSVLSRKEIKEAV